MYQLTFNLLSESSKIKDLKQAVNNLTFQNEEYDGLELSLKGIPSSPGIAFGKAVIIQPEKVVAPAETISEDDIPTELDKFDTGLQELIKEFMMVLGKVQNESGDIVAILETNLMILTDEYFKSSIRDLISGGHSAESAVILEFDKRKEFYRRSKDKILKEKAVELDQIKERLLIILRNRCVFYALEENSVVIAKSLSPTDVVQFRENKVAGLITEVGGIASHSSILARSFEIPEVIGVKDATKLIKPNVPLVINGYSGSVYSNPDPNTVSIYYQRKLEEDRHRQDLGKFVKLPTETEDGRKFKISSNINFLHEVDSSLLNGAEGSGLVRTEHLMFENHDFPDEEKQYQWYKELAQRMYPHPVTIRAFDIGSDKYLQGMPRREDNPALGFRGIRFLLSRKDIFRTQIKAVLRASKNGNVKFMLPMISNLEEMKESLKLIEDCKEELGNSEKSFDNNLPVGIMIETPSSVMIADELAAVSDFFSIGTNDLTQYVLAADRGNELVSEYFDAFHPGVLRMIKMAADAAKRNKLKISVCGELASHSAATAILVGFGIDELSVPPSVVLELKKSIRSMKYKDCKKLSEKVLRSAGPKEVREKLRF